MSSNPLLDQMLPGPVKNWMLSNPLCKRTYSFLSWNLPSPWYKLSCDLSSENPLQLTTGCYPVQLRTGCYSIHFVNGLMFFLIWELPSTWYKLSCDLCSENQLQLTTGCFVVQLRTGFYPIRGLPIPIHIGLYHSSLSIGISIGNLYLYKL